MANDQNNGERRAVQRDWVGHGLQMAGIIAFIGVPLLIFGNSLNTSSITNAEKTARVAQDVQADRLDNRAFQTEMRTALTSLSGAIAELRVQLATDKASKR